MTRGQIADREKLTNRIKQELQIYSRTYDSVEIRPRNVEPRLNANELYMKYYTGNADTDKSSNDRSNDTSPDLSEMEAANHLIQNEDLDVALNLSCKPTPIIQVKGGESLLKSKVERIMAPKIDSVKALKIEKNIQQEQPATISMSRLKLKEALCKAKNASETKPQPFDLRCQTDSPETITCVTLQPKAITILSSSQSSNSSSSDELDLSKDGLENKEKFLRYLGVCSHAYSEYLKTRRPQRKRRNCTNYHYSKFELFERQYNKRNKNQFLYSPPATRAKRRIGSNNGSTSTVTISALAKETNVAAKRAKGGRSNASSSSSLTSNHSDKVCLSCFKGCKYFAI